jgi:RNA polymerase sigma-70 factor (ECF subfamily)
MLSWDELNPEARYALEPADSDTPEAVFERRWATATLQGALHRLQQEYEVGGKEAVFAALVNFLTSAEPVQSYAQLAPQLGMTEAALKMAIHRLRRRYGELLRLEVAQTVATPAEIEEELRYLREVLAHK